VHIEDDLPSEQVCLESRAQPRLATCRPVPQGNVKRGLSNGARRHFYVNFGPRTFIHSIGSPKLCRERLEMATVRNGPMPCLLLFVDLSISNWKQHAEQQALKAPRYYPHQLQQMASGSCKFSKSMQRNANLGRTEFLSLNRTHPFSLAVFRTSHGGANGFVSRVLLSAHDFAFSRESPRSFVRSLSSRAVCFLFC